MCGGVSVFKAFVRHSRSCRKPENSRRNGNFPISRSRGSFKPSSLSHELAWKTLKDFLESRGTTNLYGSKDATREAFSNGLIEEGDVWMEMIRSRNETSHTYNEETADQIAEAIISQYQAEFEQFTRRFAALEDAEP